MPERVNFKEVLKTAVAGRELVRAIGYVIKTESGEEKAFLEALVKMGIETRIKDLQIFPGGTKKADWDVGMAVDAVRLAEMKNDAIVLVTGDGDFIPLLEHLRSLGQRVEVMAFGRSASGKLRELADNFVDLDSSIRKFLITGRGDGPVQKN